MQELADHAGVNTALLIQMVASDLVVPTDVRLYALPFSGAGVRSLSGPLDGDNVRSFDVRNGRAVYVADQAINSVFELFVATLPRLRDGSVPSGQ